VQLDGLRLLVTPMPQEEFNATVDRKTAAPSPGVACFDCHVNDHTTGQIELSPDIRPQQRRFRLDTPTVRGNYNFQLVGSKRSIRSLRDFAQFEQRTAYFNGDHVHAAKKGIIVISPQQAAHMERMQAMLDFPPAPKLTVLGRLDPKKASESELRGEKLFFGKAQCATCRPAPFYIDNFMHDLRTERFYQGEAPDGPIKTFSLRGIKDSPPYLHDGRLLTLEDSVEFFNLVLELRLSADEKRDLVAFMRALRRPPGGRGVRPRQIPACLATRTALLNRACRVRPQARVPTRRPALARGARPLGARVRKFSGARLVRVPSLTRSSDERALAEGSGSSFAMGDSGQPTKGRLSSSSGR
jgi:cytochrome c peroxidase